MPYNIRYKLSSDTEWILVEDDVSAPPNVITGLTNGLDYDFQVKKDSSNDWGSTVSAKPVGVPSSITDLVATFGDTLVDLGWSAPNNGGSAITDYLIQYKLSSEPTVWTTFVDGTTAATSTSVTGLDNGTSYDFRVAAINAQGTGGYSNVVTETPDVVSSWSSFTLTTGDLTPSSTPTVYTPTSKQPGLAAQPSRVVS